MGNISSIGGSGSPDYGDDPVDGAGGGSSVDSEAPPMEAEGGEDAEDTKVSYSAGGFTLTAEGGTGGPEAEATASSDSSGPGVSHERSLGERAMGRERRVGDEASDDPTTRASLYSVSGEAEAHASVANAHGGFSVTDPLGGKLTADGRVDLLYAGAGADGSAGISTRGLYAQGSAHADADLVHAEGNMTLATPSVTVGGVPLHGQEDVKVEGGIGVHAEAEGDIQIGPGGAEVSLSAGASAGAHIEGSATDSIQDAEGRTLFGVGVKAHGTAGAEAEAHLDAGFEHGKLHFSAGAGAALGLGGGADLSVDVDVGAIADDAWKVVEHEAPAVAHTVEAAANRVESAVSSGYDSARSEASSLYHSASSTISSWFN